MPAHRDLVDFFMPMRAFTAESLRSGTAPWINLANGCGEAWFANPETAVLYPPAWPHLVLPIEFAITLEIAFHLACFALGAGLLARHLGSGPAGRMATEAASWAAGPIVFTAGVLNNLETLAWMPWLVLAARQSGRRAVPLVAAACFLAWLGGEPQIWVMGLVLALVVARSRWWTAAGLALGVAMVAVQLVPFVSWIVDGDRGPGAAAWALRGALSPADWMGLLVPWVATDLGRMVYLESLFVGAPLLVFMLLGGRRNPWLVVAALALGLMATLPEIGGGSLFLALTHGMVRYPSRFAVLAVALLVPLIGPGVEEWMAGRGRRLAVAIAVPTLLICALFGDQQRWLVAGVPALFLLVAAALPSRRGLRSAAVMAAVLGLVIAAWPLLGLHPAVDLSVPASPWREAASGGRLYTPAPTVHDLAWFAASLESRRAWPVGYLNLVDGLELVRTDSPVAHAELVDHLRTTDEGPLRRWWLDALAAEWVILPFEAGVPEAMDEVRTERGLRLLRNRDAWPVLQVAAGPPEEDVVPRAAGRVRSLDLGGNRCVATVEAQQGAWIWLSMAPVRGWRWSVDGVEVPPRVGPGILQSMPIAAGVHRVEGVYRPPGLLAAGAVSTFSSLLLAVLLVRAARMGSRVPPDTLE
jgi:hypothetical protein